MLIIFNLFAVTAIFLFRANTKLSFFHNIGLAFVKASLVISTQIVFFTEILSFFNAITKENIYLCWAATGLTYAVICWYQSHDFSNLSRQLLANLKIIKALEWILLLFVFSLLTSLFLVAQTITSNWDSYTYHLPRVEQWIRNQNVIFFPTNNIRQLYLTPFVEYAILNLRILDSRVSIINLVQYTALLNCLVLSSLIVKVLGYGKNVQIGGVVLTASLPMALLQATNTQTDLTASAFLLGFLYFGLNHVVVSKKSIYDFIWIALCFSLGIFTKSTFYIFSFVFLISLGMQLIHIYKQKSIFLVLCCLGIFLSINLPFLLRNYQQFGSVLGPKKTASFYLANLNDEFGVRPMLSNVIKNIGLHLALPNKAYNSKVDDLVLKLHELINYPLNSPKTNWTTTSYKTNFTIHHDLIGNFIQLILIFCSAVILILNWRRFGGLIKLYFLVTLITGLLFSLLLKWQPWQTRLDISLFIVFSPVVAIILNEIKVNFLINLIYLSILILSIWMLLIGDPLKPLLGSKSIYIANQNEYIFD